MILKGHQPSRQGDQAKQQPAQVAAEGDQPVRWITAQQGQAADAAMGEEQGADQAEAIDNDQEQGLARR